VALLILIGWNIHYYTQKAVALTIDGKKEIVLTHADTVGELLEEKNIKVGSQDDIKPSIHTKIKDDMEISLIKAKDIQLVIDGEKKNIKSTASTVGEMLQETKVPINQYDRISPDKDTKLKKGMKITIKKAIPLTVDDGGTQHKVWTHAKTVQDLLKEQKIEMNALDKVSPALDQPITKDMTISVIRVEQKEIAVEEETSFSVVTKKDPSLPKGKKKVVQNGQKGLVKKYYIVTYENGKEVSRELQRTETVREAVEKIVHVGTKKIKKLSSRGQRSSSKEFYVYATAYTSTCEGCSGVTKTGINLITNPNAKVIAVDPSVIPLGSKVWVEGYGYAIAADTGGDIKGYRIDLFVPNEKQALQYGKKKVKIRIL
jgi:uncharacterized protein YabE (DUF348 family)